MIRKKGYTRNFTTLGSVLILIALLLPIAIAHSDNPEPMMMGDMPMDGMQVNSSSELSSSIFELLFPIDYFRHGWIFTGMLNFLLWLAIIVCASTLLFGKKLRGKRKRFPVLGRIKIGVILFFMLLLSFIVVLVIALLYASMPINMDHNMMGMNAENMMMGNQDTYPLDAANLPPVSKSQIYEPKDNELIQLSADIIKKEINGKTIRMFGYNGQIPGPLFKVKKSQRIMLNFTNNLDVETTIHSHGLRLINKYDGVPMLTQDPVQPGESFLYILDFPDEGIFWYHPHVREDYQQDLGLYGNYLVAPDKRDYYNQVNREEVLMIDDILIEGGNIYPYNEDFINNALMGRYGNEMLVNGEPDLKRTYKQGEVVRFYITNVASARPFNLSIPGIKLKRIGSDVSSFEKEIFVESIVIAPAERYVVEAIFEEPGRYYLMNINHHKQYEMMKIQVTSQESDKDYSADFYSLRENKYVKEDIDKFRRFFDKPVDEEIRFTIESTMPMMDMMDMMQGMNHVQEDIEWEDSMPQHNKMMTNNTLTWIIEDKKTGKQNMDINYQWKVGDLVKLRAFNDPESDHPMQHPLHLHGQRFLVLEKDELKNDNLVWKDTVLIPVNSTMDLLVDVTNPGRWMAHCHIAEHLQSGMMFQFTVQE